jgi:chromosome partitioning protein
MHTIAVVSQKGGAGKTTLALHLAVQAAKAGPVAVIDLDPQASACGWSDSRQQRDEPAVVACPHTRLGLTLEAAKASGAQFCFIDTAPHAESPALAAARSADLVVIPTRPGILDLRAIGASIEIANIAKRPAVLVVNAAPQGGAAQEAAEAARESYGIEASPAVVRQRAVFGHALVEGKTASEVEPDGRAAGEISELWADLCRRLDVSRE